MIFNITFGYMDLQARFLQYIQENDLCNPQRDRVLLGVSGGRDSMLMAHLFVQAGIEVGIAHCNFALRGADSDADEVLVRTYAETLDIPFFSKRFETQKYATEHGISIQMAARDLRYAWFESVRHQAGFDCIAVAHHASDNVETLLINLLRGTGFRGLRGMEPKYNRLIRPLLFLEYEELNAAVKMFGVQYRDDASNFSTDYIRNKLRLEVIPRLHEINARLESTFADNMERIRDAVLFVDQEIAAKRSALIRPLDQHLKVSVNASGERWPVGGRFVVDLSALKKVEPLKFVLYELLRQFSFTPAVCQDLADAVCQDPPVSGRQFHSATHVLMTDRNVGMIRPVDRMDPVAEPVEMSLERPAAVWMGQRLEISIDNASVSKSRTVPDQADTVLFDADRIVFPLQVRAWRNGDVFRPAGMKGKTKKLSDFFVSAKIPIWEKAQIPVVTDAEGVILWVAPLRKAADFNVSSQTQNILTISYFCSDGS